MKSGKFRQLIGIILLIIGIGLLGFTGIEFSAVSFGPVKITDISEPSAVRLWSGIILTVLGLVVLFPDLKGLIK